MHALYGQAARFDEHRFLTNDEMRRRAPSIFATQAHESRSDRFRPIPTVFILDALRKEGFHPVAVMQGNTRDASKRDFTKHVIRLRRIDQDRKYQVGDSVFEYILKNGNDGSARYELRGGLHKVLCLNSLVAEIPGSCDAVKVKHWGNAEKIRDQVIEGTYTVMQHAERILAAPQDWSKLTMPQEARLALANAAHVLRFGEPEEGNPHPVNPVHLLAPRRREDQAGDLWHTWNVVQEHTIRGGDHGQRRDMNGNRRRYTSREVKGIDQNMNLNKALWLVGERLAATLKKAA